MTKRKIKEKVVICDIDDTIIEFLPFLTFLHNHLYGTLVSEHDVKTWDFLNLDMTDVRGNRVTGEDLLATFHKYEPEGLYAALPVIKEARHGLELIRKLGYKIILMTARKPEYEAPTILNLIRNKIPYDELYFESDKVKKIKELSKKYNVQLFADDKLETVLDVAENCNVNNVCVIRKAHNENEEIDDNIEMIPSLFDAVRFLKDLTL